MKLLSWEGADSIRAACVFSWGELCPHVRKIANCPLKHPSAVKDYVFKWGGENKEK